MNEMQIFENQEFGKIRTIEEGEVIWFCGKDVAAALGYSNTRDALVQHCKDPWVAIYDVGVQTGVKADGTPAMQQVQMKFIGEPNLYRLITHSKLPSAERFERWVFEEVLPSIRKTGRYEIGTQEYMPTRPLTTDDYEEAARTIAKCHNSRLPIVLDMYRKAGLDIESICQVQQVVGNDEDDVDLVELLQRYTLNELCELLNIARSSIFYYRVGRVKPHKKRRDFIIQTLTGKQ